MKQISKNCYKGELIENPSEIHRLTLEKKSIYTPKWGIKPAAILLSMHFIAIMRLIENKQLFYVEKMSVKNETNKGENKAIVIFDEN